MATGTDIRTWFDGRWHEGDVAVMRAADHGAWLGTTVFDGARHVDGVTPDLRAHCARVNRSAEAMMITPTVDTDTMVEIVREGLRLYPRDAAIYIRPMYWALEGGPLGVAPKPGATGFAICLEAIPMAPAGTTTTLTTTRFRRPTLDCAVVDAKAGCLYPNNARMLAEARAKGYGNALVADAMGNVAETATANIFMVRDGEVLTLAAAGDAALAVGAGPQRADEDPAVAGGPKAAIIFLYGGDQTGIQPGKLSANGRLDLYVR